MAFLLFLLFFIMFCRFIRKKELLVAFLFFLYSVTFFMSMILEQYEKQHVEIIPSLYLGAILFFWFLPFRKIRPDWIPQLHYNQKYLYLLAIFLIIAQCCAIAESIARFNHFLNIDNFESAKSIVSSEGFYEGTETGGIGSYLTLLRPLYIINMVLFFIFLKDRRLKVIRTLLILTSLSYLLHDITAFGRDAMIFWSLNFGILYALFSNSLSQSQNRHIKVGLVILLSIVCCGFLFVTFTRFGDRMTEFLISYGGQQLGNFSDIWDIDITPYSIIPKTSETIARNLFGIRLQKENAEVLLTSINRTDEYNVFGYFIKEFVWSIGRTGTLILSYFFYIFTTVIRTGLSRYKDIWSFLILILLFQVPLHGMFYYRQLLGWDFAYICFLIFAVSMHLRVIYNQKQYSYA